MSLWITMLIGLPVLPASGKSLNAATTLGNII